MRSRSAPLVVALLSVLLFFSAAPIPPPDDPPKLTAYFIDVGMGDAIFLDIPPNDCMLVDAGSWDAEGIQNLLAFLTDYFSDPSHAGCNNTIDLVVATHQHQDHIQGMLSVLNTYTVGRYIDNGLGCTVKKSGASKLVKDIHKLIAAKGIPHTTLDESIFSGTESSGTFTDGKLDPFASIDIFALSARPSPIASDENENSIVLTVRCDSVSFLLTGDADHAAEKRILDRLNAAGRLSAVDVDILKAGHHGSRTSSSAAFLEAASPRVSIVSVGLASESPQTRNYRLPKESVVRRLEYLTADTLDELWETEMFPDKKPKNAKKEKPKIFSSRKAVYFTSTDGTIIVSTNGTTWETQFFEYQNQ